MFYEAELSRTKVEPNQRIGEVVRKEGNKLLVHWIGEEKEEWVKQGSDEFVFL